MHCSADTTAAANFATGAETDFAAEEGFSRVAIKFRAFNWTHRISSNIFLFFFSPLLFMSHLPQHFDICHSFVDQANKYTTVPFLVLSILAILVAVIALPLIALLPLGRIPVVG